jgi:hypothetical protein
MSPSRLPAHLVPVRVEPVRPPRPLTRQQAAELLGRHAGTLDRWARLNLLRNGRRIPRANCRLRRSLDRDDQVRAHDPGDAE